MSVEKRRLESERWLATASDDMDAAEILSEKQKYALACFHAQQAAEKAVKALWYYYDAEPWGHSIRKLITGIEPFAQAVFPLLFPLMESAMILDRYYIPTRYPDGLPDLTPSEAYGKRDADEGIKIAGLILDITRKNIGNV